MNHKKEKITVQSLIQLGLPVYDAIKLAQENFYLKNPSKPLKPILNRNHNEIDLIAYNDAFSLYTKLHNQYVIDYKNTDIRNREVDNAIEEYIKEESGLFNLTDKQQIKVWDKAWSDGHSEGYYRVYQELVELVELF